MTFPDFCSYHGITKAEVEPLFEYWCLLRLRGMRRFLAEAKKEAA
jgi:hypothetical protein